MAADPESLRADQLERWEQAAAGWARRADRVRALGMPVSAWMINHAGLHPGQRVLELAAGPGDTGFLAAELVEPGGMLVCSDAAESMLDVARARAGALGIDNVEFARLELEWIDLPTAGVDAVLCRWGYMLVVDPSAALRETRRVLRSGGRVALAVWDVAERNPWATIPGRALIELGFGSPPDPDAPGMFALSTPGRLRQVLESSGFVEVVVESIELDRRYDGVQQYLEETLDLSGLFGRAWAPLDDSQRAEVGERIEQLARPFRSDGGSLVLPGISLVAAAEA
jgi:ubiquinone/menaquinone biosynthesis C-methylase UbiE